ncbi:MAG: hypothetical protein IJC91_03530 [Oscillospiraceae bacterium]|nr:hypothetical protein [Oscillospiraceae bacterium]
MKKIIVLVLSIALVLGIGVTAIAAANCSVTAESVEAVAGQSITIPIVISGNSGFTNFCIMIDYDREALELTSINSANGENTYLCGDLVGTNTAYEDEDGNTFGFINCALTEKCSENGTLFTVTFKVADDFTGSAEVKPVVTYIRNNAAVFSAFEEITAAVTNGAVTVQDFDVPDVVYGDVNGDGSVDISDVQLLFEYVLGITSINDGQITAGNVNGDSATDISDVQRLFEYVLGIIPSL